MTDIKNIDLTKYKVSPLTLVFLVDNTKILTLKRSGDKKIYPNKLSGFGGKVEPGEELFSNARREFFEETGLEVKNLDFRGTFTAISNSGYINQVYIFVGNGYKGKVKSDTDEGTIAWMEIKDFLKSPNIVPHIPHYLNQVIEGKNFYCGAGIVNDWRLIKYVDNKSHFEERKQ